ncbi:DUF3048 domain-containing protein [Candidatus Saccharibacteria bacterium]|nr:DUF3048 domain-containing protein [Candidatus Saccharibacteria bacterium]
MEESITNEQPKLKESKKWLTFLIPGIICFAIGIALILISALRPADEINSLTFPKIPSKDSDKEIVYSSLTGEELADASLKTAPTFCIQTPNGTDGARPQAGLTQAGVVFEAIAEAGITRFAAIYQNPTSAIIGPIRSLRIYYLEWDTPFDCTIVHAGGSGDALAAVGSGRYRDLTENYTYMYRGTYKNRLWNNLFTTSSYLKQYNSDRGYNTSDVKGFTRLTPEESTKSRVDKQATHKLNITSPATGNTSELTAEVSNIRISLGSSANFNPIYIYNTDTNTYARSYASAMSHDVYECPDGDLGEKNPEDNCSLTAVNPSVVIAMIVQERRASDNYHEDITTIGSGDAYIFQNGTAIRGTWQKATREDQIKFLDANGQEISLAPGQTFVTAVPTYGSVEY